MTMTTRIFDASRISRTHGTVWYPVDFSGGQIIAALPDDLEPRLLPPGASPHSHVGSVPSRRGSSTGR